MIWVFGKDCPIVWGMCAIYGWTPLSIPWPSGQDKASLYVNDSRPGPLDGFSLGLLFTLNKPALAGPLSLEWPFRVDIFSTKATPFLKWAGIDTFSHNHLGMNIRPNNWIGYTWINFSSAWSRPQLFSWSLLQVFIPSIQACPFAKSKNTKAQSWAGPLRNYEAHDNIYTVVY